MKRKVDLLHGNLFKSILLFSLPLVFSNLLQVFFHMADVAVVGRFSGPTALGAVGSTATLVSLFTGFLIGLGSGINVCIAKYIGQGDKKRVSQTVHTAFLLTIIVGLVLMAVGELFSRKLLELLGTKSELIAGAELYMRYFFAAVPGVAIYNYGNAVFSSMGDTKKPLIILSVTGVLNVILNLVFVIVFDMSVEGVALSTFISQYISSGLLILLLFKSKSICALRFKEIKIYKSRIKELLKLGVPSGFQHALFAIANLFIQSGVNSLDTVMVEGNSAAINADALIFDIMAAFYVACSTFIGQNHGANNKERVLKSFYICLLYSFTVSAILGGLLMIFARQFLSAFTTSEAVMDAGVKRIMLMGWAYCFSAFMDTATAASRGLGKTLIPTIIVISGVVIFRIVWVKTIFAYYNTYESLYLLYIFSYVITSIPELIYFAYIYKKTYSSKEKINGQI